MTQRDLMLKCDDTKTTIKDKKALGILCGNLNQDLTAALTDLSNHFKYFLLLVVNTNWWYRAGMRLVLRMNKCCWGFKEAEVMFPNPSFSLPAMSNLILIGESVIPMYHWVPVMLIAGIACPKTHKWRCGLTIHIFLLPSTSIHNEADLPSRPVLPFKLLSLNSAVRSFSRNWRPPVIRVH